MDVHVPETQVFNEAALVPIMAAVFVESNLEQETAENMSAPSQELPVNVETEEPVTNEEATPEVNVPFTAEPEPEPLLTNSSSEEKGLEVEEQDVSPESRDAANVELNDDIISLAAAEPGPEFVAAVVTPVSETFELLAQHSVEETTEVSFIHIPWAGSLVNCNKIIKEVHIVEVASEPAFIVPNEGRLGLAIAMHVLPTNSQLESTVEPVEAELEIPEAGERSDTTAEAEPQIISPITEDTPTQIEEDRLVLATLQVRELLFSFHLLTV